MKFWRVFDTPVVTSGGVRRYMEKQTVPKEGPAGCASEIWA